MKIIFLALGLISIINCSSQTALENAINDLSVTVARKMQSVNKKRIAVINLTDINKTETIAGKYIADVISIDLLNDTANFQIFDRQNLDKIMKEMKLNAEGYIDESSAKQLGKLLSADAIVSGNYVVLGHRISVTLKVFDTETAYLIAGSRKDIPLTDDACALLGINCTGENNNQAVNNSTSSRGFNAPVQSGENYNNPETVSKDCEGKNFGDYCFENKKDALLEITYAKPETSWNTLGTLRISPGQTQCIYQLASGVYDFDIIVFSYTPSIHSYTTRTANLKGQFLVEKCKSKTYSIPK
ncbi:MAG TPA: CsgG/HfaB family protein [Chitinophagales bacterium]|nr:CsgG/HfaB family protein [Chitinophagales bacterium]